MQFRASLQMAQTCPDVAGVTLSSPVVLCCNVYIQCCGKHGRRQFRDCGRVTFVP